MGTAHVIAKLTATGILDKRALTGIGSVVVGLCMPLILAVVCIMNIAAAGTEHNKAAVNLAFSEEAVPDSFPSDYGRYVEQMRESFAYIDVVMEKIDAMAEDEVQDRNWLKSVFYSLYFGASRVRLSEAEYQKFVECFVRYEERTRIVEKEDGSTEEEVYLVTIPVTNKIEVFENLRQDFGKEVSYEQQSNALNIWYLIEYGTAAPSEGDVFEDWDGWNYRQYVKCYDLEPSKHGKMVVELAKSRLGNPYSQAFRGRGSYTDCSYLTMWCYRQLGIMLPGTAAEQARYLVENQLTISKNNLQPGDLVFWSYKPNGRFMNITHVGVYAGDGMVVDASSSRGKVVYRNLFDSEKQMLYGRPQ